MTAIANLPDLRPSLLLDFANSGRVDPRILCTRASAATCFGPDGKLRTVADNVPRIDYDPATGKCLGLLVEESRTNLLTYSAQPDNSVWTKTRAAISANVSTAPDGTLTADKLVEDATENSSHQISRTFSYTSGQTYTRSLYAKAAERHLFRFQFQSVAFGAPLNTYFDLQAGMVVGSLHAQVTARIEPVGDGWYRCSATATATATVTTSEVSCGLAVVASDAANSSYSGDGVSGLYLWGAQLEEGAFPTSYIPTEASAVTRAADVPSVSEQQLSAFGTLLAKYGKSGWKHTSTPVSGSLNLSKHIDNSTQVNDKIERLTLYPRQLTSAQIARLEAA